MPTLFSFEKSPQAYWEVVHLFKITGFWKTSQLCVCFPKECGGHNLTLVCFPFKKVNIFIVLFALLNAHFLSKTAFVVHLNYDEKWPQVQAFCCSFLFLSSQLNSKHIQKQREKVMIPVSPSLQFNKCQHMDNRILSRHSIFPYWIYF